MATIRLPATLPLEDFTSLAVAGDRPEGRTVYCNVEGVSWLSEEEMVVVSDRAKRNGQDERCRAKDQSIHVFVIPASG